ncbi:prolipoprotein diacylglyceryl transferase family protein [Sphingomonas bacterium]|uniref:prolipoprotein diacylglyceryl transferase family protein n=1 Tax=Sphingomonas bacterium TaxID=1895847 RepID=UPI001577382C|nr:prolipoprotein diacylglyceryl transferase family protein [Sphingomonas bacterium]
MLVIPTAPWAHGLFDILAWASSAGLGATLHRWRLRDAAERLARATGPGYFAALAAGALVGAWAMGSTNTLRMVAPVLSHSIAGALAGAIVAVEIYKRAVGLAGSTGTPFVGPLAMGIVVGRWGCLFAGLPDQTYGVPTSLPWAVDLGDGIGRHPVQVYESLAMLGFLLVYLTALRRRRSWAFRRSFYLLSGWYGAQRFAWEFLKPYPRLIGPLNIFHLLCLGLVAYACAYHRADVRRERAAARRGTLSVLWRDDEPV